MNAGEKKVVLATSTFYQSTNEIRYKLAIKTILYATMSRYPIIVVDASTDAEVRAGLVKAGAIVYPQSEKGMGPGRRQMFSHAVDYCNSREWNENAIIVWIEPEKVDVIRSIERFVSPFDEGADVVIFKRSRISFERTYPDFQIESETLANDIYNKAIGRTGYDPMSGPVAFRIALSSYFVDVDPETLGLSNTYVCHYSPLLAMADGFKVVSSPEINFYYPEEQRREEETTLTDAIREKRKWQFDTLAHAYQLLGNRVK